MFKYISTSIISVCLTIVSMSCLAESVKTKLFPITEQSQSESLYYTGKIQPSLRKAISSPITGHIESIHFSYGQTLSKNTTVIKLRSSELTKKIQDDFQKYINAKDKYTNDEAKFKGTKMLYDAGVTDRNSFLSEKSNFNNDAIAYFQSKYELEKTLDKARLKSKELEALSLSSINRIKSILSMQIEHYPIKTPYNGIALMPGSHNKDNQPLFVGKAVKEGETLLTIGRVESFQIKLMVSEIAINKIHEAMRVRVTSPAFPGITLTGEVIHTSSQADPNSSSNRASEFKVLVKTDPASKTDAKIIKVGMSCKVEIQTKSKKQLFVSMHAVKKDSKGHYLLIKKGNDSIKTPVEIGQTTVDGRVAVKGKIKSGQEAIIHVSTK